MRPRVLLTNDDGVNSIGLWAAYEALAPIADVTVVAPATQQSAVGRSISIFEPLRVDAILHNGVEAHAVAGKPTDAVIIGLFALQVRPDLIVSGINIGENLSFESVMTSGTVGAALEGANHGVPGIAFSLQVVDQGDKFGDPRRSVQSFTEAGRVVSDSCERIFSGGYPEGVDVININIPARWTGGYEITRLAPKLFATGVERRLDPRGRPYFWIDGPIIDSADPGTDVSAIREGRVSVTPLTLDLTAPGGADPLTALFQS